MDEVERIVACCKAVLPLERAELGGEYGYNCLPLCVIDAVWSIGVRYGGVKNVVARYCTHCGLHTDAACEQHGIEDFLHTMQAQGVLGFADKVFRNAQRTSTRNGILKAEAVYLFASVLHKHGMNTMKDVPKILWYEDLHHELCKPYAQEILTLPGQRSGISLSYFYMLTGSSGLVKPDRMVFRFLTETLGRDVTDVDSQRLISYASRRLNTGNPQMTPRMLDHQIWKYQSGRNTS